jgi:hypothetical protein
LVIAEDVSATRCPTGSSPTAYRRVESPASIFSIANLPRISVELNSSYDKIGNSPAPSAARTRGRVTGTRRPLKVTDPRSRPCRTAVRAPSWRPCGPASAVTSASINAASPAIRHHGQRQQTFAHRAAAMAVTIAATSCTGVPAGSRAASMPST